ncbi:MAG: shikimate dehydrogenase [Ruminiclostridium sp.]|nr:shikimate dehydrogenase [Ruminiclostridium sp.]
MKKYALIGHPLGHSLSPQIHERLMKLAGIDGSYKLLDIPPEELTGRFAELEALDGFNATIPHKVGIIPYCGRLDDSAERFGSVNCVKNGSGKVGYNTDVFGFTRSIDMLGASLASRVLVIGCGGVGRMIAAEAAYSGGRVTVAVLSDFLADAEKTVEGIKSRMPAADIKTAGIKGAVLCADDFGGSVPEFDLLINASPVGMFPKTDAVPCSEDIIRSAGSVFDVIYNPNDTLLTRTARELGKPAMTGMAMLVLQAAAAQEIWNGASFAGDDLKTLIADMENMI